MTEAAFTLIIYFVMRNVLQAHLRSLFACKHRTKTKITCVHGHQKNTVKNKPSVKKMATNIFGLVASWHLTKKVNFEPWICSLDCLYRVRICAFLVANATKKFALATRISQLIASGRLTLLFHATIITQTIALIFSQIDQKIQSHLPIGHFLFTFPLLWKYFLLL